MCYERICKKCRVRTYNYKKKGATCDLLPTFHNPTGICLSPGELSHTFEVVKGCETFKNDTGLSEGSMVDESVLY